MMARLGGDMLATVFEMSYFLWTALAFALIVMSFFLLFIWNVNWKQRRMRALSLLFGMPPRYMLWIAQAMVREAFIISVVVFRLNMNAAFLMFFTGLVLIGLFARGGGFGKALFDLVNSAAIAAALIVTNILWVFLNEIRNDVSILVIYILISVFVSVYNLYFGIKDLGDLFERDV
ncbi:MAG: hypothetical protein LBD49_01270 [Oscillospiraceae bacterium]|jgi:hypothetical protein|nr:hypothetical protein [Oscillospiraceae bacterium]